MSDSAYPPFAAQTGTAQTGSADLAPRPPGLGTRFAARLIRLRHSRGRLLYVVLLAFLTGLVMNGPLDVAFSVIWFLSEGFSAPIAGLQPGIICLSFTAIVSLIYAALWAVTMLLLLPLRMLTEWTATLVFIGAVLHRYAPQVPEALPSWPLVLAITSWVLNVVLIKSGLAHRPLPWLTRHHRTRFTLPMPPLEAYHRLRARPGQPHWDKGWAEVTEAVPVDDSTLQIEVRRRAGAQRMFIRYRNEHPGQSVHITAALSLEGLDSAGIDGETLRLSPHGSGGTLVEVQTHAPHTISSLASGPMEDQISDYWAHAAAQIAGRPDGTFTRALLRPAKATAAKTG